MKAMGTSLSGVPSQNQLEIGVLGHLKPIYHDFFPQIPNLGLLFDV